VTSADAPSAALARASVPELVETVVQRARVLRTPGRDEFVVRLELPHSGEIQVSVVRQAESVSVVLHTPHEGLRRELQANLPSLERALGEHGLALTGCEVGSRQQPGSSRDHAQHTGQPWRQGGRLAMGHEADPVPSQAERATPASARADSSGWARWA
jgi:flagellar hook-length control protein FliK